MGLFDFFNKTASEQKPDVKVVSVGGALINYDLSFEVYYKYYNLNPFVFSCINKRSNDVGAKGYELTKGGKTNFNSEFEKIVKTSTTPTPKEFFKRIIRDYDVTGNAYVYVVRDKQNRVIGLQVLDPRYVKPVTDKYGQVIGYIQNLNGLKAFASDEIYHLKNDSDIDNEVVGKSRMTSLFIDIESDQEARDSNLAFFKNNQTPSSLILVDKDYNVDAEGLKGVAEKIKEMFEGGKYQGGKNRHRSLIAKGITGIVKAQDKISDAEFLELRKFTLEVVSAIYEVPKGILGFAEGISYTNGNNQYDTYWDNIENLEDKLSEFMNKILQLFDPRYKLVFLKDNVRKLVLKAEIAGSLYKDKQIITLNEAREIIQYAPTPDGDTFFTAKTPVDITQNTGDTKQK